MVYHNRDKYDAQMIKLKTLACTLSFIFFIASLVTLPHYGVNWDAISHLSRGQAFLHYYLNGEKSYSDLKDWNLYSEKEKNIKEKIAQDVVSRQRLYFQNPDTIFFYPDISKSEIPRISLYQNAGDVFVDIKKRYEYGHPHISDTLSSVFNFVLFQKLGLLNDVDSYRVYSVLLSSLLVGLVFWWTASLYGKFAGLVAGLSLALYPLFWSESHFNNEKDIPETVFWTFMLFSFWRGITAKSWKWILASGVFFGLALGTKFNVLFSIFVIVPWLISYLSSKRSEVFSFKVLLAIIASPLLGLAIVTLTWPDFFSDPVRKIERMVDFYKTIGTTVTISQGFIGPFGINTYALQWILYTTPLMILFLAILGISTILKGKFKGKDKQSLLFLLMFLVPIVRVTWPGTNIYGGVRQIMEFIPAMAILAGIGGSWLVTSIVKVTGNKSKDIIAAILLLVTCYLLLIPIIQTHPNENVYFNPLIGGLKGAKERNFPGWGVSFGAPYREAIEWINRNAEPGSKLTTGHEILSNIPGIFIRPDIEYKSNRSGYLRQGEYVISLRFQGSEKRSYFDMYLDRMIEPLYQISVDSVPILKIWKNDKNHLKPQWSEEVILDNVQFTKTDKGVLFDIGESVKLSRMEIEYDESNCPELSSGYFMVSKDGQDWERIPGVLPEEVRIKTLGTQPNNGKFIEPFAGQEARYIDFNLMPVDTCVTQVEKVRLYHFN